jgi:hypothetical protein
VDAKLPGQELTTDFASRAAGQLLQLLEGISPMGKIHGLGVEVTITISGECGRVVGRAEYLEGGTQYHVHYKDANGAAKTEWFYGHQLSA